MMAGKMEAAKNVSNEAPAIAHESLKVVTTIDLSSRPEIKGYDFNRGIDYHEIFKSFSSTGFQASNFSSAVDEIWKMIHLRNEPLPEENQDELEEDEFIRRKHNCTIFLGFTSNMSSCGVRDIIRFLVEHKMVDCLVTTCGGIEEDIMKCMAPTYLGEFNLRGRELREQGVNRIGNLLVPNNNYCDLENFFGPILDEMLVEQKKNGFIWTPSKAIARFGEKINNPESFLYWAFKNNIPVFSPALTDGAIGDQIYFHSFRNPGLILDIANDICRINNIAIKALKSGMIILGGGVIKHHICNANLFRNGADFSVYVNTSSDYDGSDAGATPDEAVSWGKIKPDATPVKVHGDASFIFPLLVGETFARWHHGLQK